MSVAFILNPGYNTINNIHHTFWDQEGDAIANSSLTQALAVSTSVAAPSHVITGGTNPAQLFMSDPITLETDAPQFKAPILQAPSAELEEITELTPAAGITFLNDAHFTSGTGPSTVVRDIDGVGTLTCSTLKYTTLDPAIPEADVSQWATFGASTNVNLNGNNLIDSTRYFLKIPQSIEAKVPSNTAQFSFGNSGSDTNTYSTLNVFTSDGQAGVASGALQVISTTRPSSTSFNSKAGCTSLISNGGDVQVGYGGSAGSIRLCYAGLTGAMTRAFTINNSGALAFNSTFISGTETVGNFGTAGQIIQSNGSSAAPSWVTPQTFTFAQYVLYVAKNGLDANAGNITSPKLTIQSAINAATALYPQQVAIIIAPGVYTENIAFTRPNISLIGYAPSSAQNLLTQIVGSVDLFIDVSQDLYYSQICLYNLHITGLIWDSSNVVHTFNIEQCRLTNSGQVFVQSTSANNRTRLFRCVILQSDATANTDPMLRFTSGDIYLNELEVTAKNNCNVVQFEQTAKCPTCAICLFTSETTSPVAEPIINIRSNGTNTPFVFTQSAFVYSSYVPKTANPTSAGIRVAAQTGRPYISVTYNSFALAGTNGTNYAIYDSNYNTATAGYYFFFSNNGGVNPAGVNAVVPSLIDFAPQASAILGHSTGSAQNKFTLTAVA